MRKNRRRQPIRNLHCRRHWKWKKSAHCQLPTFLSLRKFPSISDSSSVQSHAGNKCLVVFKCVVPINVRPSQSEKCVYVPCWSKSFFFIYSHNESAVVVLPCWLQPTVDLLQYCRQLRKLQSTTHEIFLQYFSLFLFLKSCFGHMLPIWHLIFQAIGPCLIKSSYRTALKCDP